MGWHGAVMPSYNECGVSVGVGVGVESGEQR
jgi:hypothetical protein